jgi:PAS domain S-box-containing protein
MNQQEKKATGEDESRCRALVDQMNQAVAVYRAVDDGEDFVFVDFNRAAEEIEKVSRDEIVGKRVTGVFPGVIEFGLLEVFRRVWRTGTAERHPISSYQDDRIVGWRDNYVFRLPSGEVAAVYTDATEARRSLEKLRKSEEMFRTVFERSPVGMALIGVDMEFLAVNPTLCRLTGYTESELKEMTSPDLIHPDDRAGSDDMCHRIFSGQIPSSSIEKRYVRKDGRVIWANFSANVICDTQRKPLFAVAIVEDISAAKEAEQEMRIAGQIMEAKHRALQEKNIALKGVLAGVEGEKNEVRDQVRSNVDRVIMPTLRLLRSRVDEASAEFVDMLDSGLRDITSPFINGLQTNYTRLSPGEIEICRLVKDGLSSKEIANLRGVSVQTVSMQRKRIRKKLGLTSRGVSLQSTLRSLSQDQRHQSVD